MKYHNIFIREYHNEQNPNIYEFKIPRSAFHLQKQFHEPYIIPTLKYYRNEKNAITLYDTPITP